jgi:hypothetical protein
VKPTTHLQLMPGSTKCGSTHPLPHTSSWRSAQLVKHRDNSTVTLSLWNMKVHHRAHNSRVIGYFLPAVNDVTCRVNNVHRRESIQCNRLFGKMCVRNASTEFVLPVGRRKRLCGLVVRVSGYRSRSPVFDSRPYQIF